MIRLPARPDGQWTVSYRSDKLPDLSVTKNLTMDREGYIRLSKPTNAIINSDDDADFGTPLGMFKGSLAGQWMCCTNEKQFTIDMYNSGNYGLITIAEDTNLNTPDNTNGAYYADVTVFNQLTTYANPADQKLYTHSTSGSLVSDWTVRDVSASMGVGSHHVCNFASQSTIAVANNNVVDQFTTAYATSADALTIPSDYAVTGLAYNNGLMGVTTGNKSGSERCFFFVWDGNGTSANYSVEVPAVMSFSPTPYLGSFVFVDGNGQLLYWTETGLQVLAQLPSYWGDATLINVGTGVNPRASVNHSIRTDGEIIHVNISSEYAKPDEDGAIYSEKQSGGVWTYDPPIGLYHRHSPSGIKMTTETIATTAVNTTTDQITVTSAPETGTPVRYSDGTGTAITGLTNRQLYYAIYVDATHIQLASTYANAVAGTEIDLTGTGNNNQSIQIYPKTAFGQNYLDSRFQGAIHLESVRDPSAEIYYEGMFIGSTCADANTTEKESLNMVLIDTENRGYFVTSKFLSSGIQDEWQKLLIKHKQLIGEFDKIIVKYRTDDNKALTIIKDSATDGLITWSDSDTFTTTDTQWANVQAGDEVEFIQGTGAGYLAHVSSISEAGGTYTVNIDETIKNLTASTTGRAVASRWTKLNEFDSSSLPNDEGYFEIVIGKRSKSIQFKIELRGESVEIEELLVVNAPFRRK